MKTNAWHYNNAIKELEEERQVTVKELCGLSEKESLHCWLQEAVDTINEMKAEGVYPYNIDVADRLIKKGIMGGHSVVYGSQQHLDHLRIKKLYEDMFADGWLSIHDITLEDHGKKAIMSGSQDSDFLTTTKDNEKIKLVCTDSPVGLEIGYMRPKMRTRYFRVGITDDLFIKLIK